MAADCSLPKFSGSPFATVCEVVRNSEGLPSSVARSAAETVAKAVKGEGATSKLARGLAQGIAVWWGKK